MVRQYARVTVRGVGGGRANAKGPSVRAYAPQIAGVGNGRVRATNARRKA